MPIQTESYDPLLPHQAPMSVLVAEDPIVSSFLRTILERKGYRVTIGEPQQSCESLLRRGARPPLVITNRPEEFLAFAGTLPVLYIAAAPDHALAGRFFNCRVLRKPFRNADLLEALEDLAHHVVA